MTSILIEPKISKDSDNAMAKRRLKPARKGSPGKTSHTEPTLLPDADEAAVDGRAETRAGRKPKGTRGRATSESMAKLQREISVSEFFAKNRHLLGFDNPRKALLTTVKEAVDNSLDACEEAGILPNVTVVIEDLQRKVEYRKYYNGRMKNVELATL